MHPNTIVQMPITNRLGEDLDIMLHEGTREGVLVFMGHGVTGDKDRPLLVALAEGLAEQGWSCLRISFSGNGESEGKFEESTITKEVGDLDAVLGAIPKEVRVIYVGHSMGGAVGVKTAAGDSRIVGLVSLAGMVHCADFVKREFGDLVPDQDVMWEEQDCPLSKAFVDDLQQIGSLVPQAAKIQQPWLLVHGSADDVVPLKDSQDARDAAKCDLQWLEIDGAGHVFDADSYPKIIGSMDLWLNEHFG